MKTFRRQKHKKFKHSFGILYETTNKMPSNDYRSPPIGVLGHQFSVFSTVLMARMTHMGGKGTTSKSLVK